MARKQPSKTRTIGRKVCPYDCPFADRMLKHEDLMLWSGRLESGMDKFAQATQQLAVNFAATTEGTAQRIDAMEKTVNENQEAIKIVETRIEGVRTEVTERLDQQTKALTDHFDRGVEKITEKVEAEKKDRKTQVQELADRTGKLEKWQSVIIGGSAVVAFIVVSILVRFMWVFVEKYGIQLWNLVK